MLARTLQPESNGENNADGNGMVGHLADTPLGHLGNDTNGFPVQTLVTSAADDADIAHTPVGADDETAQHASLDAVFVSMIGIFAGLVDEIDKTSLTTGELWLDVHIVKLIDLDMGLLGHGVDGSDMTHLRYHGQRCGQRQQYQ